ncbi:MarR family winged helix-turn-helix transcriptional regulator [Saccharibacillus kuerlensis]|uniref:MarR family transcriptional regulator n=1 Tax=Saccharibacillus kuerlensis TaxID=459527 RepID=A0ABQ2L1D0_9BACL|nr:MarR family transcriptional regulator [Saccharibacillus kuerlensis]GGN97870.1 MarR family transcriptional regulator [Saccharibacillus kuerlensis]
MENEADTLGFRLSRTYLAYAKAAGKVTAAEDMTPEQYGVLHRLTLVDGISQKKLASLHARDQTSISKALDKLEQKEMIVRRANPVDRRSVLVYLTEKGRETVNVLTPLMQSHNGEAIEGLSEEELNLFIRVLDRIFGNLSE